MIWHRRKNTARAQIARSCRIESLENRCLLTGLAGGDEFWFQQASGVTVTVRLTGNILAEVIGAVVDDRNQVVLTDLPGRFIGSATGRGNGNLLGGIGGADGVELIGTTFVRDVAYGPGNLVSLQQNGGMINFNNVAAGGDSGAWGINVGTVNLGGNQGTRKLVQVAQFDAAGNGNADVAAMIQQASLREDVAAALQDVLSGGVGDMAADPTTGDLYVVTVNGDLYTIDRDGAVLQIGTLTNTDTGATLTNASTSAMAFNDAGELWIITRDYDGNPGADASGIAIGPDPQTQGAFIYSDLDVALVRVDKATATFVSDDVHSILSTDTNNTFEVTSDYTAMLFDGNVLYAVTEKPQDSQGGGGGTPQDEPWELHRFNVNNPAPGSNLRINSVLGDIQVGGDNAEVHGMAWAENIWGEDILVALDRGTVVQNAVRPRLIAIDVGDPGASDALSEPGTVVDARGLAAVTEPGDTRPLLYTVTGATGDLVRGSAVSLPVDPESGASVVNGVVGADFHPISGLLYFVADEEGGRNAANADIDGRILHTIDVNAVSRSAIQNSLTISRGNFDGAGVTSIAFDQTSAFTARLLAVASDGTTTEIYTASLANTDNSNQVTQHPIQQDCADWAGTITGIEFYGDDPINQLGDDPTSAETFLWAITSDGANSALYRIRLSNPGAGPNAEVAPTAFFWGALPDPDDQQAPIRGQNLQGLAFIPDMYNPFTFELGALVATDVTSDEMVVIDTRFRPQSVNVFNINIMQSDADARMLVSQVDTRQGSPTYGQLWSYDGDVGQFRIYNAQTGRMDTFVSANGGTGRVLLGIKTNNVNCDPNSVEDLRPIAPEATTDEPGANILEAFGMVPMEDGFLPTGLFVNTGGIVDNVVGFTDAMIRSNLDMITAASVRADGLIAVLDSDASDINGDLILSDQLGIIDVGQTTAGTILDIVDANGDPLEKVMGADFADPDGDGVEDLYAIYNVGGVVTLGIIDLTTGVFTAIGPVDTGLVGVQAMAFSPEQHLYVIGADGAFKDIDPLTGALVSAIGNLIGGYASMDFSPNGILYAHDLRYGRLVEIDETTGMVNPVLQTGNRSVRTSIGAISWDPVRNTLVGLDNGFSREVLGDNAEGFAVESSMLVTISGLINEAEVPQDLGMFHIGGTVTGRVDVSGSLDSFYAGWLLTGAAGGQVIVTPFQIAQPTVPQNFRVGGELRDLIVLDSIGSDSATAMSGAVYSTGFDLYTGGKLGHVASREDYMGSVDVANGGVYLPAGNVQIEAEGRFGGFDGLAQVTANGQVFRNDSHLQPQYLGAINSAAGVNVIQVQGVADGEDPTVQLDGVDRYHVALMAGQTVVVQLIPLGLTQAYVGVFDPDRRLIASDYSDVDSEQYHYQRFSFTADRPGLYEFAIGSIGPTLDFYDGGGAGPYELRITASYDGVTAPGLGDLALGGLKAAGTVFDARETGSAWHVRQGDMGAIVGNLRIGSLVYAAPASELMVLADPTLALDSTSVEVNFGSARAVDGGSIGAYDPVTDSYSMGVDFDVINGSIGLVRATDTAADSAVVLNDDIMGAGPTAVSDHDAPGIHPDAAVGGDLQMVSSATRYYGAVHVDRAIGVVRADDMTDPGWFIANADREGDDGVIDLISANTDLGNVLSGGPAVITGPSGNVRYMYVGGTAYRDYYFGTPEPETMLFQPGETATFYDDSGTTINIVPVFDPNATTQGALQVNTFGIRGSGGVVVVNVTAPGSLSVTGRGDSDAAGAEIGHIGFDNAAQPGGGGTTTPVYLSIGGDAKVDVFDVTGGDFTFIQNPTDGEFVNITAGAITLLEAGSLGVPRTATGVLPAHINVRTNAFPFGQQRISIDAASIGTAKASRGMGNLNVTGNIDFIIADSDRRQGDTDFDGIVAPVYAGGDITDVSIGRGISSSGSGVVAHSGIYADGAVGVVRGESADIRGNVVSLTRIDRIQLTGTGSIVNANILVLPTYDDATEFSAAKFTQDTPQDPVTNPGAPFDIASITIMGTASRQVAQGHKLVTVPGYAGGIIGSYFTAADIGPIRVTNGYGVLDSTFTVRGDGTYKDFLIDGYGVRDTNIIAGASLGRLVATGKGQVLDPNSYSSTVRQSEVNEFMARFGPYDTAPRFEPNRTNDIHAYLGTRNSATPLPTTENVLNAGVIAGTTVKASRDMRSVEAWQVRGSTRLGVYSVSDFDIANSLRSFLTSSDADDVEITTGRLNELRVSGDFTSPSVTVAGLFSDLFIGGDFIGDDDVREHNIIEALGANGEISRIVVNGDVGGLIWAQRRIGTVTVRGSFVNNGRIMEKNTQVAP